MADQESIEIVPKAKPSLWKLAGSTLGGWKTTLACQRRESTKLLSNMVNGFEHVLDADDNVLARTLTLLENATHINRRYLFVGAFLFAVSYLSMGRSAGTLCNILGMVYPIYASIKATEGLRGHSKEHWISYWIVYSTLSLLELLLEIFLVWLPMYYLLKFAFLSWCMAPVAANGSHVIYGNVIRPLFYEHSEAVDSALSSMTQHLTAEAGQILTEIPILKRDVGDVTQEESVRQRIVNTENSAEKD